ncbi:uncharacterized protein DEA37_0011459 [Paragonimus westermani]|uniref:Ion transport domain-containing protein n=1 Tax=Paragonimus westermani TaxID=34504 RepID=A0A5J4P1X5_9TREM|nr:uncharacterized protein DEA37_0011459 [Paragonimus westermani]
MNLDHQLIGSKTDKLENAMLNGSLVSYYNVMDWAAIALYLASYSLRIIVDFKVQSALSIYRAELRIAQGLLDNATCASARLCPEMGPTTHSDYVNYRNQILTSPSTYWLRGCRLWWAPDDPEYVSDCLFAMGNVLSFARISHLMPAWELLGPLQISLARMISDIIRFMALFSVMVIAFVVGLTNLYWYFANIIVSVDMQGRIIRYASGIPAFRSGFASQSLTVVTKIENNTGATFYTLYWALFGQSSNNVTTIDEDLAKLYPGHASLAVDSSPLMINNLGSVLYAIYNACMTIILLNMLIAMMSKSFDEIQGDRLEEWKFARASLWMVYIDQEGVLPPPLNLLPSKEALSSFITRLRSTLSFNRESPCSDHKLNMYSSALNMRTTVWTNKFLHTKNELSNMSPFSNMKKTITANTVSTALDCSPVHSNSWASEDEEVETDPEKAMNEFKLSEHTLLFLVDSATRFANPLLRSDIFFLDGRANLQVVRFTDAMRANVLRRHLFKLQKMKEAESKAGELSIINYQRQQTQKAMEKDLKLKQDAIREQELSRRESKGHRPDDTESNMSYQARCDQDQADENRLRGLSSLLMPPSVRKKLEAVAAASSNENDRNGRAAAEAVARYYLLETTRQERNVNLEYFQTGATQTERTKKNSNSSWKENPEELFTARTERPLKGAHLRELYRVEQEMHDMSEALSSHSLSEATISEINELEKI